MIASIQRISHVGNLARYLLGKDDAEVLALDTLLFKGGGPRQDIEQEIEALGTLRPKVDRVASHLVLSLPPGKSLDEATWLRVLDEMRQRMGYDRSPILAVMHHDNGNQHVHVIAGTIDYRGERVADAFEGRRVVAAAAEVRQALGLEHVKLDPGYEPEPREAPVVERGTLSRLRKEVEAAVKEARSVPELIDLLREQDVRLSFNVSPTTGRVAGVSYQVGEDQVFKGRSLGKHLAWPALERRYSPTLADLPHLLRSNSHAGRGPVTVELAVTDERRPRLRELLDAEELPEKLFFSPSGVRDGDGRAYLLRTSTGTKHGPRVERTLSKRELRQALGLLVREASDVRDFIRRATDQGIRPAFNVSHTTGHVSGVKYQVAGRWYKGSTLGKDFAWQGLRRRFDPRLEDLPALLAANEATESGVTLVERKLAPHERKRMGLQEDVRWLWIATPRELRLADFKEEGVALVADEGELAQVRKERAALGRQVGEVLKGLPVRTEAELAQAEKVIRDTTYADERLLPLLHRYPSLRRRLPMWRKELLTGKRNDFAVYLAEYKALQQIRHLRLAGHVAKSYESLRPKAGEDPKEISPQRLARLHTLYDLYARFGPFGKTLNAGRRLLWRLRRSPIRILHGVTVVAAEEVAMRAFELPASTRMVVRLLRGRFQTVALLEGLKAIKAEPTVGQEELAARRTIRAAKVATP